MSSVRVFYPKYNTQTIVKALGEKIESLKDALPVKLVVLFGSYARGNYTVASDIDLLVVYKGEPRKDAFSIVKKIIDLPELEPHVYTESEYTQTEVIQSMIKTGKVIYKE